MKKHVGGFCYWGNDLIHTASLKCLFVPPCACTQDGLETISELTQCYKPLVALPTHTGYFGGRKGKVEWTVVGGELLLTEQKQKESSGSYSKSSPLLGAGPRDCQVALEGNGTHLKVSLGPHCRNYNQCHLGDGTVQAQEKTSEITEWNRSFY